MNLVRKNMVGANVPEMQAHLLLTEGEIQRMGESPELAMEEIRVRATQISSVLEDILHDTHAHPHWGINE